MREIAVLLVWPGSALIAGLMAQHFGRSPWPWFLAGFLTGPFAPVVALLAAVMPRVRS